MKKANLIKNREKERIEKIVMLIVAMSEVSPPLTEYIPHDYRNPVFDNT